MAGPGTASELLRMGRRFTIEEVVDLPDGSCLISHQQGLRITGKAQAVEIDRTHIFRVGAPGFPARLKHLQSSWIHGRFTLGEDDNSGGFENDPPLRAEDQD